MPAICNQQEGLISLHAPIIHLYSVHAVWWWPAHSGNHYCWISSERSNWSCKTPLPKSGCKSRHNGGVFRHSHLVPLARCRTSTVVPLREIKSKFVTSNRLQNWTSRMHWFTDRSRGTQTTAACWVLHLYFHHGTVPIMTPCFPNWQICKLLCQHFVVTSGIRRLLHIQHRWSTCTCVLCSDAQAMQHGSAIQCHITLSHHHVTLQFCTTNCKYCFLSNRYHAYARLCMMVYTGVEIAFLF